MAAVHGQVNETIGLGFVDKRRSTAANTGKNTSILTTPANFNDVNAMETRLLSAGYTQAQLNVMTLNDKVYAVRLAAEAAGTN